MPYTMQIHPCAAAQSLHQLQTAIKRPNQRKHSMNLNNAALLETKE